MNPEWSAVIRHFWWAVPLTLAVFFAARALAQKTRNPLLHPLLVSIVVIGVILFFGKIPYADYFAGNFPLNFLLQPAVVALALPLYRQLPKIVKYWKSLLFICFSGSLLAMASGVWIAKLLGAGRAVAASILPKSVTTPVAVVVSQDLGGYVPISVLCVIFVGLLGGVFAHGLLRLLGISENKTIGLSVGTVSHAIGTARCAEINHEQAAFSSLALALCCIFTALTAPWIAAWLL